MPRRHKYPSFTSLPRRINLRDLAPSVLACERCGEHCGTVKQVETKHGPESVCYDCRQGHADAKRKGVLENAF